MSNRLSQLNAKLAGSKKLPSNDAAYQTITEIINSVQTQATGLANAILAIRDAINALTKVLIIDVDTSTSAQVLTLTDYNFIGFIYVFKDVSGNASANTITLVGTVDGVVDPVINTDYGLMRIYLGPNDNLFHEW